MRAGIFLAMLFASAVVNSAGELPYAGEEQRAIKSLSAEEIESLSRGDGMGYAKAAELNQYPGPKHVLELAGELELSDEQQERTTQLFAVMRTDAVALGMRLIAAEAELDRLFAAGPIDDASLKAQLTIIADLEAQLRFVHLAAHLQQKGVLSEHQVAQYVMLRGYHGSHGEHHQE